MLVAIGFVLVSPRWPLRYSAWGSSYNGGMLANGGTFGAGASGKKTTTGTLSATVANNFISATYGLWALGYNDAGLVFLGAGVFFVVKSGPVIFAATA